MKIKISLLSIVLTAIIVSSCDNTELQNVDRSSPALHFEDTNSMIEYFNNSSPEKNKTRLTQIEGVKVDENFVSLEEVYSRAVDELFAAQTIEQQNFLLEKYKDIVSLSDTGDEYVPKIKNSFYRLIANTEGIYYSNGYIHRVFDSNYLLSTKIENSNELKNITSIMNLDESIFQVIKFDQNDYSINGRTKASCGSYQSAEYIDDVSGCSSDRKVIVEASAYYIVNGQIYNPMVLCQAKGYIKTGVFCKWKSYSTVLSSNQAHFKIPAFWPNPVVEFVVPPASINGSTLTIYNGTAGDPIYWSVPQIIPTISFTSVFVQVTSQGIAPYFATIDCI